MSYNTNMQTLNGRLQLILDRVNSVPDPVKYETSVVEITNLTVVSSLISYSTIKSNGLMEYVTVELSSGTRILEAVLSGSIVAIKCDTPLLVESPDNDVLQFEDETGTSALCKLSADGSNRIHIS